MAGPGGARSSGLRVKTLTVAALGPAGMRALIAGSGALAAAVCGVALALALRLPAEMTATDAPPEAVAVDAGQTAAEANARAYALQNPPVYRIEAPAADQSGEAVIPVDASDPAAPADDAPSTDATPVDRAAGSASPS